LPAPPEEVLNGTVWITDPQEVMELRAQKWCKVWQKRPGKISEIKRVDVLLRELALRQGETTPTSR
jgi:hypothetical protein